MNLDEFVKNIDFSQLDKEVQEKTKYVQQQRTKMNKQVDEKISNIILVKKRKLQYNSYVEAAQKLKLFLTSSKNLIDVYFNLLDDEEKLILYNFSDLKDLVEKFRFCLSRSVHNMNRMLIKDSESAVSESKQSSTVPLGEDSKKQQSQKKKKKKKGKNSKMSIEQTGCMYKWILQNFENPYPSQEEKQKLSADSKISISKVNYWFINMRERTLKKLMAIDSSVMTKKKKTDKEGHEKSEDLSQNQESEMAGQSESES